MGDQQDWQLGWLVRYQVMAQLRVHFSQLFFGTIFATLASAFGIGIAGRTLLSAAPAYVCFALAANFAFGATIANRLMLRERGCYIEMQAAWRRAQSLPNQPMPTGKAGPGAMNMLSWAIAALAVVTAATGLLIL